MTTAIPVLMSTIRDALMVLNNATAAIERELPKIGSVADRVEELQAQRAELQRDVDALAGRLNEARRLIATAEDMAKVMSAIRLPKATHSG